MFILRAFFSRTRCQILHLCVRTHIQSWLVPTLLIPVLDWCNGTWTKGNSSSSASSTRLSSHPPFFIPPQLPEDDVSSSEHVRWKNTQRHRPPEQRRESLQSANPGRLTPICLWGPVQHQTVRFPHMTPTDQGLGECLKGGGRFRSRLNMVCSAALFHCQHLHPGNIQEEHPGNTFLYMKPNVDNLSAWVSGYEQHAKCVKYKHLKWWTQYHENLLNLVIQYRSFVLDRCWNNNR